MTESRPTAIFVLLAALACSSCSDASERRAGGARDHNPGSDPDSIGRSIYVCEYGANYSVHLFAGGLTLDLSAPTHRPPRMCAFTERQNAVVGKRGAERGVHGG